MSWFESAVFYHIYPLGFFGSLEQNDLSKPVEHKILGIIDIIPHLKTMNFNAVYFGPVFQSVYHGYDTIDYKTIDRRLGTNEDFAKVCKALHDNDIKVVVDGVFNHVGREFSEFKNVRNYSFNSIYKDWFNIREGNSAFNDGFAYDCWEGHQSLVKLNLYNGDVREYIKSCIKGWVDEFDIDGIRFDVAYCLDTYFLKDIRPYCKELKHDFWLMGETLHGDYNKWMNDMMLDSVTNYECYKGLFSSFNELNMFEIAHSLNRQFGAEQWTLYKGKHLYCFADNHDVNRIASMLKEPKHLPLIYTLLFTMPGIPSVYYGSEFGAKGVKTGGDDSALRPVFDLARDKAEDTENLHKVIAKLAEIHAGNKPLCYGSYNKIHLTNRQFVFMRECDGESVITAINCDSADAVWNANLGGTYVDALSGEKYDLNGNITLKAYSAMILVVV